MREQVITMPVVALRGLTVLPGMVSHSNVNEPKSVAAVERAMMGGQKLFLIAQRHPETVESKQGNLSQVGTVAVVKQLAELPGKVIRALVEGLEHAELLYLEAEEPTMMGEITAIEAEKDDLDSLTQEAMLYILKDELGKYGGVNPKITEETLLNLITITDLDEMLDQIAIRLSWGYAIRQIMLEDSSLSARYEVVIHTLLTEVEIYRIKEEFQEEVKADIDQNQKEYILREQMKVTRQELRENAALDTDKYQEKLDTLKADKEVKEKLHREIECLRNMPAGSQEANMLHTYVETLLDLSWRKISKDNGDIKHAGRILDKDHYGLERIKERILEYLAIRILTKKGTSPIICLVEPPGTGKTSTARPVARALNKEHMRIGLGGVRDEVEIRDHRETYVSAMLDHIVEGMRQTSVSNPLMLLGGIGRVSNDYKDDTSSTLLRMLDGEQSVKFRDHYVKLSIDLPRVLFIAATNTTQTIPGPLLDRTELIEVNNYTESEKFHIARDYLVTRQMERNNLKEEQTTFSDKSLEKIVHDYIREADVRSLERRIGDICHKAARQFPEDEKRPIKITENNLEKYLGKEEVTFKNANEEDEIGIMRGLAWTSVGGDTLQIEVSIMPGKGSLLMTGRLGDVTKELAQIALTYTRSVCPRYGTGDDYFERHDLHIHIPGEAVPKDGPSAGITMTIAMLSTVTGKSVQAKVAMTEEITLRGRVLPIRGLKEGILVAKTAHIRRVLVPDKSHPGMAELSKEITRGLNVVYVETMEGVVSEIFV